MKIRTLLLALVLSSLAPVGLAQETDLLVTKEGPAQAAAGTDVTYDVDVTNLGPDTATAVTLTDPIPAGMTFRSATAPTGFSCTTPAIGSGGTITCTGATLAAGTTATFVFVMRIDAGAAQGETFVNIATATTDTTDVNEENDSGIAVTSTPPPPQVDMRATKSGPSSAGPDTDVTYVITVTNGGPDAATDAEWEDTLPGTLTFVSLVQNSGPVFDCTTPTTTPGGTITCDIDTFAAGASATFTLTAHVPPGTASETTITNTATVGADENDPNEENNASTTTLVVSAVDVSVLKTGPATAVSGTNISYGITVENAGPNVATNVVLTDSIPADTTFVSLTHDSGPAASCTTSAAAVTCTYSTLAVSTPSQYTLVVAVGNTSSVSNTATVSTESFDTDNSDNTSTVVTAVTQSADLRVSKSGPPTAVAGTNVTFTVTAGNDGPSTASNVSLTDTIPPGSTLVSVTQTSGPPFACSGTTCTIAAFASGATATFQFVVTISPTATGVLSNTAQITSSTSDPDPSDNTSTTQTTVSASADVAVTKSAPATVAAGTNLTFTVSVVNDGPSAAANVTLTDVLPPGTTFVSGSQPSGPVFTCSHAAGTITCTIASLLPGTPSVFQFVVAVAPGATGTITNTATVTSTTPDPVPGDNASTSVTTVTVGADVAVTKSAPASVVAGTDLTFTLTVVNDGPATAANVTLTDTVPAGTTFVSATQAGGPPFTCTQTGGTVACTIASLAPAAAASFTVVVNVPPTATGTIVNTATVSSPTPDPVPGDNSATTTTAVTPAAADLSISKTANVEATVPGAPAQFTIVVANAGPGPANGVVVTDVLPPGTTLDAASAGCTGTTTVTCNVGTLSAGNSATITLQVRLPLSQGSVVNTATVTSDTTDPSPANNASTTTIAVANVPGIPTLSPWMLALLALALAAVMWIRSS